MIPALVRQAGGALWATSDVVRGVADVVQDAADLLADGAVRLWDAAEALEALVPSEDELVAYVRSILADDPPLAPARASVTIIGGEPA